MIHQVPREKLVDFLSFFKDFKYLKNILALSSVRGNANGFVDNLDNPEVILYNCSYSYLVGNHKSTKVKEILNKIPEKKAIINPGQEWVLTLKNHWKTLRYFTRTALSAKNLSLKNIQKLIKPLPGGFTVERVDLGTAKQVEILPGHLDHYGGPEVFIKEGLGFCVIGGKKVVCLVAGDMVSVPITKSVEIYLETHPNYRRRGFAIAASAKFIEQCLKQRIEPHWDAANERSVKLALKLGYTDPQPYKCYYWENKPLS
jgi:GNAT superfamily N-acetyltransferase